jgi:protein-tyrosine phosphatase
MAERLLRHKAAQAGVALEVQSAGIAAADGAPISENARILLERRGIDASGGAKSVTPELIRWADLVLTMTMGHKQALIRRFPDAVDKIRTLKEYAVDDPETVRLRREAERLAGELQMKLALSEPIGDEERRRWVELERALPSDDVADPFGGDLAVYEATAAEIEQLLERVLQKVASPDAAEQAPDAAEQVSDGAGPAADAAGQPNGTDRPDHAGRAPDATERGPDSA